MRPYTRTPPRTTPDSMIVQATSFQRRRFAIVSPFGEAWGLCRRWPLLPQFHAGTRRPCHQLAGPVGDIALDVAQGAARLDDLGLGGQPPLPDGPEEVDLQLDGRQPLPTFQPGGLGVTHPRTRQG